MICLILLFNWVNPVNAMNGQRQTKNERKFSKYSVWRNRPFVAVWPVVNNGNEARIQWGNQTIKYKNEIESNWIVIRRFLRQRLFCFIFVFCFRTFIIK